MNRPPSMIRRLSSVLRPAPTKRLRPLSWRHLLFTTTVVIGTFLAPAARAEPGDVTFGTTFSFRRETGDGGFKKLTFVNVSGAVEDDLLGPVPVTINSLRSDTSNLLWNDPTSWGSTLQLANAFSAGESIFDVESGLTTINPIKVVTSSIKLADLFANLGPTERSISLEQPITGGPAEILNAAQTFGVKLSFKLKTPIRWDVTIDRNATMFMTQDNVTLHELNVSTGSTLYGNPTMLVKGDLNNSGTVYDLAGKVGGDFNNYGTARVSSGYLSLYAESTQNSGTLEISTGGTFNPTGDFTNHGDLKWSGGSIYFAGLRSFANAGNMILSGSEVKNVATFQGKSLLNTGKIFQSGGPLLLYKGTIIDNKGGYELSANSSLMRFDSGTDPVFINSGTFLKSGNGTSSVGANFNNTGIVEVTKGTLSFQNGFTQTSGGTLLNGGNLAFGPTPNFKGGLLSGTGTVSGNLLNEGATVSPGHSPGQIDITGDYTQLSAGTLYIELAGGGVGEFDVLNVGGRVTLGGTLEIALLNGFRPTLGETYDILTYSSLVGQFDAIHLIGGPDDVFVPLYGPSGLTLVTAAVPVIVPEPTGLALFGVLGVGLLARRRRRAG